MTASAPNTKPPDILKLEAEISYFFEAILYEWGGSPLLGRIYAVCVLTGPTKHVLQKDLVPKFNVNPSTISRILKELETWRLLDRRREPGSREWKYQVEPMSFLELLVNRFENNAAVLRERKNHLKHAREYWGHILSEQSKQTEEGKRALQVLDFLMEWITIVEGELDSFTQTLHKRFFELKIRFENQK